MSRREGSAEKDFDEAAEGAETANPLAATGAKDARGQASFAPSARALRRMPEGRMQEKMDAKMQAILDAVTAKVEAE